jgi:hypothetical protein
MAGSVIMETIKPIVGRQNRSRLTLQYSSAFRALAGPEVAGKPFNPREIPEGKRGTGTLEAFGLAAAEITSIRCSRDFRGFAIFNFFNSIPNSRHSVIAHSVNAARLTIEPLQQPGAGSVCPRETAPGRRLA